MEENFTVHSIGSGAGLRAAILMIGAGSDAPQMKRVMRWWPAFVNAPVGGAYTFLGLSYRQAKPPAPPTPPRAP
jgi:hypothetical protein